MQPGRPICDTSAVQPEIELRHFRYVVAVAEEGTFTAAAARLGMTQPALSRAIRVVEAAVGAPLFERGPSGATLTAAGRALRDDAVLVTQAARTAITRASRNRQHLQVTARACDIDVLEHHVRAYNITHGAQVPARAAVVEGRVQLEQLRTADADMSLVRTPFDDQGFDSHLIRSENRVALIPIAHPLAGRQRVDRAELAGEAIPVWPDHTRAQAAHWAGADLDPHRWSAGPIVTDSAQFSACIRLGQAIGFVPEPLLPELSLTGIAVVDVAGISKSQLRLVWADTATARVAPFVQRATEMKDITK